MADLAYVSTAQLSRALGVGVTTVKRWVDEGILPAHKTAGGHRKLLLADVLRVVSENEFPRLDLGQLGSSIPRGAPLDETKLANNLFAALRQGDAESTRTLMGNVYRAGVRAATLADRVIAPAMTRIGLDWASGRLDVLHEHRATQICAEALCEWKSFLAARVSRPRPAAVGGAPEGQLHGLGSQLAEIILLEAGWAPVNLGPNTPFASFRKALGELRPRLLWLSVNPVEEPRQFLTKYRQLYAEAEKAGVAVAVGGCGLTTELRAAMPYTTYGDGLSHLSAFAASLHPRPRRRSRGRPRRSATDPDFSSS